MVDVKKWIKEFSMDSFLDVDDTTDLYSAFLLITDCQYVMGYTENKTGLHSSMISAVASEITGKEMSEEKVFQNFIVARMLNDPCNVIIFDFSHLKSISLNQFLLFEDFMHTYQDDIQRFCIESGRKGILVLIGDKEYSFEDLSFVYQYLKTLIGENKRMISDVSILGKDIDSIQGGIQL